MTSKQVKDGLHSLLLYILLKLPQGQYDKDVEGNNSSMALGGQTVLSRQEISPAVTENPSKSAI